MKLTILSFALLCAGTNIGQWSWALDKAHVHVSAGVSPNTLLYRYTVEKGFYKDEGLDVLLYYGDHLEFVTAGVVVTEKTLNQRPDFVRRFLRGMLKGFWWFKTNERDVVSRMARSMKLAEAEAAEVYRSAARGMSADGTISRGLQDKMLAFQRKALKVEREVSPESVYDFS